MIDEASDEWQVMRVVIGELKEEEKEGKSERASQKGRMTKDNGNVVTQLMSKPCNDDYN